jgi:ribosomal protein S8
MDIRGGIRVHVSHVVAPYSKLPPSFATPFQKDGYVQSSQSIAMLRWLLIVSNQLFSESQQLQPNQTGHIHIPTV